MKKTRIAFDLDGVIIDKPPIISKKLLERLFRGRNKNGLHYRFPHSKLEQKIRKLSHFYLFRPPIRKNIEFIRRLAQDKKYELYIISGRYSFLERETAILFKKWNLNGIFKEVFLDIQDEQPHLFKERILKELKPSIFIDDEEEIINYLEPKLKNLKFILAGKDGLSGIKDRL